MKLPVLCPQEYEGMTMRAVPCSRCDYGWNGTRCTIPTGAEHLPISSEIPTCPIQDRCQHQLQATGPCVIRLRGLVCESALAMAGLDAASHPLGFNAEIVAGPEEIAAEK